MKKKAIRNWFVVLFVLGAVVGWLLPGNLQSLTKQVTGKVLKPTVVDVSKRLGQLDMESDYFKYTVVAAVDTGSIELLRVDDKIPLHMHPKENHFVYIYKGKAKATVGNLATEVWPGQLVAVPAGTLHEFERIGDTP